MLCNGSEQDLDCSCICYFWGFYFAIMVSKGTFMQWQCTKNGNILPSCSSDNIVKRPLFTGIRENNLKHCTMHARPCKNAHFVYTETIMESISQTCTLKPPFSKVSIFRLPEHHCHANEQSKYRHSFGLYLLIYKSQENSTLDTDSTMLIIQCSMLSR